MWWILMEKVILSTNWKIWVIHLPTLARVPKYLILPFFCHLLTFGDQIFGANPILTAHMRRQISYEHFKWWTMYVSQIERTIWTIFATHTPNYVFIKSDVNASYNPILWSCFQNTACLPKIFCLNRPFPTFNSWETFTT